MTTNMITRATAISEDASPRHEKASAASEYCFARTRLFLLMALRAVTGRKHITFYTTFNNTWELYQMETGSALLALCAGNSPVTGEFPSQRPVTRSFDVFFHLRQNERLSKLSRRWWFETPSRLVWRNFNNTHLLCCGLNYWFYGESILRNTGKS